MLDSTTLWRVIVVACTLTLITLGWNTVMQSIKLWFTRRAPIRAVVCTWCGEVSLYHVFDKVARDACFKKMNEHDLQCSGNPLLKENIRLRKELLMSQDIIKHSTDARKIAALSDTLYEQSKEA